MSSWLATHPAWLRTGRHQPSPTTWSDKALIERLKCAHIKSLTLKEAVDVLVVAEGLLVTAARQVCAVKDTRLVRRSLQRVLKDVQRYDPSRAPNDAEQARARDRFYAELILLSGNTLLPKVMPTVLIHLLRIQFAEVIKSQNLWRHDDYKRIVDAVVDSNADRAERAMRAHFKRSIKALSDHVISEA